MREPRPEVTAPALSFSHFSFPRFSLVIYDIRPSHRQSHRIDPLGERTKQRVRPVLTVPPGYPPMNREASSSQEQTRRLPKPSHSTSVIVRGDSSAPFTLRKLQLSYRQLSHCGDTIDGKSCQTRSLRTDIPIRGFLCHIANPIASVFTLSVLGV